MNNLAKVALSCGQISLRLVVSSQRYDCSKMYNLNEMPCIYDDIFFPILFKHFKNIEEMSFPLRSTTSCKELFHELNRNCKNLKALTFSTNVHSIDYEDENMKNVL